MTEPASIRYKNPGAMWGSALAIKWGAQKMKERHAARTADATEAASEDRESPYLDAHDSEA